MTDRRGVLTRASFRLPFLLLGGLTLLAGLDAALALPAVGSGLTARSTTTAMQPTPPSTRGVPSHHGEPVTTTGATS